MEAAKPPVTTTAIVAGVARIAGVAAMGRAAAAGLAGIAAATRIPVEQTANPVPHAMQTRLFTAAIAAAITAVAAARAAGHGGRGHRSYVGRWGGVAAGEPGSRD